MISHKYNLPPIIENLPFQGLRKYIKDQDFILQKALFHPQKHRFKTLLGVIFYGILYINNKLLWSDNHLEGRVSSRNVAYSDESRH